MASQNRRIAFKNESGEAIPPYAPIEFAEDCDVNSGTGAITVKATKPTGTGPYALNTEKPVAASGEASYGECVIPLESPWWAKYTEADPPATAWETEVGPLGNEWVVSEEGTGFLYAGLHEPENDRILVMQLPDNGGGETMWVEYLGQGAVGGSGDPDKLYAYPLEYDSDDQEWKTECDFNTAVENGIEVHTFPGARYLLVSRWRTVNPDAYDCNNPLARTIDVLGYGDVVLARRSREGGKWYITDGPRHVAQAVVECDSPAAETIVTVRIEINSGENIGGLGGDCDLVTEAGDIYASVAKIGEVTLSAGTEGVVLWDDNIKQLLFIQSGGLDVACGLEYIDDPESEDDGKLRVKVTDLAGDGLTTNTAGDPPSCELKVAAGCGITVDGAGVSINAAAVAGVGLIGSGCVISADCEYIKANCTPTVYAGCGITINGPDGGGNYEVSVDASALAGSGLMAEGECGLAVKVETGVDSIEAITNIEIGCDGGDHYITYTKKIYIISVGVNGLKVTEGTQTEVTKSAENCCCPEPEPCANECEYTYDEINAVWAGSANNCVTPDCECPAAPTDVGTPGEVRVYDCVPVEPPPPVICGGQCIYEWEVDHYFFVSGTCENVDCECPDPPAAPEVTPDDGDQVIIECVESPPPPPSCADCIGTLPATLNATISSMVGCVCATGTTISISNVGHTPFWSGSGLLCGSTFEIVSFECSIVDPAKFYLSYGWPGGPCGSNALSVSESCDPLNAVFNITCGGCAMTVTVTL